MSLLTVSGLEAGYQTGQVLFDVDLAIEQGERVSILGRNGAGKTTILRSIIGADEPTVTAGTIKFQGNNLRNQSAHEIATQGIGFVPEERRCFPELTVEENIQVAVNSVSDPRDPETVFEQFPELEDMRHKRARNMSGGEQQMLAIARALAANPTLMLLDEPSEGLAPYIVRRIEEIITRINENEDITILFVEQNVVMALSVASRHYIIDEGSVVAEVSDEELRGNEELRQQYLGV